jgi:hypothetical protein
VVLFNIGPVTPCTEYGLFDSVCVGCTNPHERAARTARLERLVWTVQRGNSNRLIRFGVFWLFIFKVTEPNSIPYGTHSACAKKAANPDPPPVIPLPESGVAEVTHLPSPLSLGEPRPNQLSSEPGSSSGPKCFQVLGLSPSLLQNPML